MTSDEKQIKGSVMVIGGGITGIQASLDIAEQGFKVYLVETTPSIGGRMAQLDKTFPTNDCSICIEAPKMVEVLRHPNIELKTYHEVLEVEGEVGNFKVRLLKKPRYVVDDKCNGCGKCVEACLITASNEFEMGLGQRKAIYIPFPQAVPNVAVLDPLCRDGTYYKMYGFQACVGTCTIDCAVCKTCPVAKCMIACKEEGREAIELWQRARKKRIYVGSIIVATGYDLLEPKMKKEYGYGIYKNVLTSLQYERLICASGPTSGEITRLSDGKHAHKIAWIQCVGSRDKKIGIPYCCRVGCMYATKEAIITKEHDPSIETYIFYQDLKAYAKRFEDYMKRAKELGIKYVRSRVANVSEDPETKDLIIAYENVDTGAIEELRVDIVNLAAAFVPSKGSPELAEVLGIELDEFGFFKERDPLNAPLETTVPGIYLAGCCTGPKDIPESISTGGAAATKAIIPITEARNTEISQVEYPPEIEVKPTDEPRIGVFVCDCGHNIAGVINVAEVAEYAKPFRNVVHSEEGQYLCSADFQEQIKQVIEEKTLNRVVVACCTPRTHEPLFRVTLREAGLNPYLLEFTNIREHCSWVHMNEPEKATEKAKDLVRMGITKARYLQPQEEFTLPVGNTCLVVGGGIAGMSAALSLADMNFKVKLVEKDEELGGMLRKLNSLFPHEKAPEDVINPLIEELSSHENIDIYTNTTIKKIDGFIGNFLITITDKKNEENKEFKADTIIVATGIKEIDPTRYYYYGMEDRVITQLQLEEKLKNGQFNGGKNVVIINCVGARDPNSNPHCCRVGCGVSLKNATHIKKLYPETNVYILYRDLMTEDDDRDKAVIDYGVNLIRYLESRKPEVYKDGDKLLVKVYDLRLAEEIEIEADSIVLTMAIEGNDTEDLRAMLRVTMGAANFFEEAHVKLRPLEFATDGIYLCGGAHSSQTVEETIAQAIGVASKASIPMSKGLAKSEGITSLVDTEKCIGCGICVSVCPYDAIRIEDNVANVIEVKCKGCGCCGSSCIEKAITMRGFTDEQLMLQSKAALIAEEPRPKEIKAVVTE